LWPKQKAKVDDTCLHPEEGDGGEEVDGRLEVHQLLLAGGGEVVAVHGEVDAQRVVQLVQQLDELLLAEVGGGKAVAGRDGARRRRVRVVGVNVGKQSAHHSRHARAQVLGGQAVEVPGRKKWLDFASLHGFNLGQM
jgi:hypothetical protein